RAGVERVDRHLAVGRTGDLHAAVGDARGGVGDLPALVLADVLGLREEVEVLPGRDAVLAFLAGPQQLLAARLEGAVELGDQGQSVLGEDFVVPVVAGAGDLDPVRGTHDKPSTMRKKLLICGSQDIRGRPARSTSRAVRKVEDLPPMRSPKELHW